MNFSSKAKNTRRLLVMIAVLVVACGTSLFFFTENRSEVGSTLAGVETVWISSGVEMVRIPAGEFMMGSCDDKVRNPDEGQSQKDVPPGEYVKVSLANVMHHRHGEIQYRIAWVETEPSESLQAAQ